jgi:hypothetical protein
VPSMVVLAFGVGRPWWWQRARKRRSRPLRVTVVPASWVSSAASSRVSAVARVGSGEGGEGGVVGELEDLVAVEEVLEVGSLEGRGEVEEGAGAVDADAGSRSPVARGRDVDEARAARPEAPGARRRWCGSGWRRDRWRGPRPSSAHGWSGACGRGRRRSGASGGDVPCAAARDRPALSPMSRSCARLTTPCFWAANREIRRSRDCGPNSGRSASTFRPAPSMPPRMSMNPRRVGRGLQKTTHARAPTFRPAPPRRAVRRRRGPSEGSSGTP